MKKEELNNKHHIECNVIMLPTNEPSKLLLDTNQLLFSKLLGFEFFDEKNNFKHVNKQELYITLNEEIKEGDWYYSESLDKIIKSDGSYTADSLKVISSTNSSLNLPLLSDSFITEYIKKYNKGKRKFNILIEIKPIWIIKRAKEKNDYSLIINKDNTINIIFKNEKKYNKNEMEQNLIYCVSEIAAKLGYALTAEQTKIWNDETHNWISKNLK